MSKTFSGHFDMLLNKLKKGENFAFSRYSDGEMIMLQNKKLILHSNGYVIGETSAPNHYDEEDHKEFDPTKHEFFQRKLVEAYQYKKHNYYVGLSCRCCVGDDNFNWMVNLRGEDDECLTWANLWVNANFPRFIEEFVPSLKGKNVVIVSNEKSNISGIPFNLVKHFKVGKNCIVNDYSLIETIKKWIDINNIENHVFLFSASTLSNYLCYELFKEFDNNTYIDIGTTMNKYFGLTLNRAYLQSYYNKQQVSDHGISKVCIW